MTARALVLLASAFLMMPTAFPALAKPDCSKTCTGPSPEQIALCKATQCGALVGKARRACMRTCGGGKCPVIRTLAYVVSECRQDSRGLINGKQRLQIRRGDCDPVPVLEVETADSVPDPLAALGGICRLFGQGRSGYAAVLAGGVQRLSVSPDGSAVVFELTTDYAEFPLAPLPPEQQGFYHVRSDGSGLRWLGPASRDPIFRFDLSRNQLSTSIGQPRFSPNGRTIVFTDLGMGPAGEEAIQIVTQDLTTGRRTQLTRSAVPFDPQQPRVTCCARFVDDDTIRFATSANLDGSNPAGQPRTFTVQIDGTGLKADPAPVALSGSEVVETFTIVGRGRASVLTFTLPGAPIDPVLGAPLAIREVFLLEGKNLLQLTNFHRNDTSGGFLSVNRRRVFFTASVDPLGTNPTSNCQLFSLDTLGAHLRQHTYFRQGDHSVNGCGTNFTPIGCRVTPLALDPVTGTLVFDSNCDPFGTNPYGNQLFAMRPGGSGLRQLTQTRGFVPEADGTIHVELPGPFAYSR